MQIFTVQIYKAFFLCNGHSADRAALGRLDRTSAFGAFGKIHFNDFRNDIAALFNADGIADTDAQTFDFIEVVESRTFDRCTGEPDRVKVCDRRDASRATDLEIN